VTFTNVQNNRPTYSMFCFAATNLLYILLFKKKHRSLLISDFLFHRLGLTLPTAGQIDVFPEYVTHSIYLDCVKVLAAVFALRSICFQQADSIYATRGK